MTAKKIMREEKVKAGRGDGSLHGVRVLAVCEVELETAVLTCLHDHKYLESQYCVRAETGRPAGLAGSWTSSSSRKF